MRSAPAAEASLWQALRANHLDGSQHHDDQPYDDQRTRWFESQGYSVLRFWNADVTANLDGVLKTILHAARPLSPLGERRVALSPAGEGL